MEGLLNTPMQNNKYKWLLLIGVMVLTAVSCSKKKEVTYKKVRPFYGPIQVDISTTGRVNPKNKLSLKPSNSGRIDKIMVTEGQKVHQGQTIALMSSTERAALIDASRAKGGTMLKYWQKVYTPIPIVAPIDGTIIARSIEPGQTVSASSTEMFVISDYLIVEADVDETDIGRVRIGQKAIIVLDPYPEQKTEGVVKHIAFESTTSNNVTVYIVDILPVNTPSFFRSGMSATVTIIEQKKDKALLIERNTLVIKDDKYYAPVPSKEGTKPELKEIKTGLTNSTYVEIISGITAKDKVLVAVENFDIKKRNETTNPFFKKPPKKKKKATTVK